MTSEVLRLERPLETRAIPHRYVPDGLDFEIVTYEIDGTGAAEPEDASEIRLDEWDDWETLELGIRIAIDDDTFEHVFHPDEREEAPGMLVVAARCRDTYLRKRIVVEENPVEPSTYEDEVSLRREDVRDEVKLTAYLIRAREPEEAVDVSGNYGTEEGLRLADGSARPLRLDVDDEGRDEFLPVLDKSFSDAPERFPPEDRLYYLDFENDRGDPTLWLNQDHPAILQVMDSDSRQYDKLTDPLIWNQFMAPVWTRLLTIAAREYDPESDEWEPEWQATVFEQVHERLYEDEDVGPEEAARRLHEALDESSYEATRRIEDAVQTLLEMTDHLENHIERRRDR